jgi:hypothetical protein
MWDRFEVETTRQMLLVITAISLETHGEPGTGELPCPVCRDGRLRYVITYGPKPRRLMASCTTPDCVRYAT